MKAVNSWITLLQNKINNLEQAEIKDVQLYIFGSCLTKSNPEDIDLCIVFDLTHTSIDEVISVKHHLSNLVEVELGKNLDVCMLSKSEVKQSGFIAKERGVQVIIH